MLEQYIEIKEYNGNGYHPLIFFESWRVAIARADQTFTPGGIEFLERHLETDEVFVLLDGSCILYFREEDSQNSGIQGCLMEKGKLYNVKKDVWHAAALSEDAIVLIVENADTTYDNSDVDYITPEQRKELFRIAQDLDFHEKKED